MATITFKAKNLGQLTYLRDLLQEYQPTRTLRSSTAHPLHQPYAPTLVSCRAFSVAAPTVWNQLTVNTRTASTLGTVKARLKTELILLHRTSASPQRFRFSSSLHVTYTNIEIARVKLVVINKTTQLYVIVFHHEHILLSI